MTRPPKPRQWRAWMAFDTRTGKPVLDGYRDIFISLKRRHVDLGEDAEPRRVVITEEVAEHD